MFGVISVNIMLKPQIVDKLMKTINALIIVCSRILAASRTLMNLSQSRTQGHCLSYMQVKTADKAQIAVRIIMKIQKSSVSCRLRSWFLYFRQQTLTRDVKKLAINAPTIINTIFCCASNYLQSKVYTTSKFECSRQCVFTKSFNVLKSVDCNIKVARKEDSISLSRQNPQFCSDTVYQSGISQIIKSSHLFSSCSGI